MIKVFAFDLFGTIIDVSSVPREDMEYYGHMIRRDHWAPLQLPGSFAACRPFEDFMDYPRYTKRSKFVTLSNAPLWWQVDYFRADSFFDAYIPLESRHVYKPHYEAYRLLLDLFPNIAPTEMCMITANEYFGDLESARALGIQAQLVRGERGIPFSDLVHFV